VYVEEWCPTDNEMERYLKREAELAEQNVRLLRARYGRAHTDDTLHSQAVFFAGFQRALRHA